MAGDEFFEAPDPQNIIKTKLVVKYFGAWATNMLRKGKDPSGRIAYIDLFAGPGRFADGKASTPLWILNNAISRPELCARLITIFNDKDPRHAAQLRKEIDALPGIENLAHRPQVSKVAVGSDLVALFRNLELVPTLFFIDPWGYKGLSLDLIGTAIKNWGCDCIFFFNYNRINPGINNPSVVERMNDLFGAGRAERLRAMVKDLTPDERQTAIISEPSEALKEVGGKFVLPFEFESQHGERTSHYIIFVSKAFLGYHLMKDVMSSLSTDEGDVRQFKYVPVKSTQMTLFPDFGKTYSVPLLKDVLVRSAAGMCTSVWDIYERFTVDTPYTFKHVQDALRALEAEGRITIDPPADRRPKRHGEVTLAKDKMVTFPP